MRENYEAIRSGREEYAFARYHWHFRMQVKDGSWPLDKLGDLYSLRDSSDEEVRGGVHVNYTTDNVIS